MLPLALAAAYKGSEGEPIYCPFPGLRAMGAYFRRGQLSTVAGPPGVGKTAFVTSYMLALRPYGQRVLFFSADSDRGTVSVRVAAAVSGQPMAAVERAMKDPSSAKDVLQRIERESSHIGYCFDSSPTAEAIRTDIICYALTHGMYPDVIVIDNLLDIDPETSGSDSLATTSMMLKGIASETGAAVIVLHHVTGPYAVGSDPIPIIGVYGQISKPQRLILTLHSPQDGELGVSVVKNSNGPARPDGSLFTVIQTDLSCMNFLKG